MRAWCHYDSAKAHQRRAAEAFWSGLMAHAGDGDAIGYGETWMAHQDLVVVWGARKLEQARQQAPGARYLILEAGYINGPGEYVQGRLRFVSASWDAPHGRGLPPPGPCPSDRWDRLDVDLAPWRELPLNPTALVCEQIPGDPMALGARFGQIAHDALVSFGDCRRRSHPVVAARAGVEQPSLLDDLLDCAVCVTWNSNAAVDAVIAGVPTIALDPGSIAWAVTSHDVYRDLYFGERETWARELAYRQWTLEEIASGECWHFLKYGLAAPEPGRADGSESGPAGTDLDR